MVSIGSRHALNSGTGVFEFRYAKLQRSETIMTAQDSKLGDTEDKIFVGKGNEPAWLTLALANRHGLVTGATGTGKTVSLQVMAEGFARAGISVFAADIKGDLSGISAMGEAKDFILKRAK